MAREWDGAGEQQQTDAHWFRALFEQSPVPMVIIDDDHRYLQANPAACEMFGLSRAELIGRRTDEFAAPPTRGGIEERWQQFKEGGPQTGEWQLLRPDGTIRQVEYSARPNFLPGRHFSFMRDVTERKLVEEAFRRMHEELDERVRERTAQMEAAIDKLQVEMQQKELARERLLKSEEQLRSLSSRILSIQEEERSRLAREVHDELGQVLTALKMECYWMSRNIDAAPQLRLNKLEEMCLQIDATILSVQRIATELRPGILDELGLAAAIEWQAREFEVRTAISCNLAITPRELALDTDSATTLFRIFQEALTNVARHAGATEVGISLRMEGGWVELKVADNGRGIRDADVTSPRSLGLIGMRERLLPWGGEVLIHGERDSGTTIRVRMPLSAEVRSV